ncbi:MAG: TlpA family protein disulfide reductase [Gammaproteobacteria bacterium]|nr:TlpA family protein disulfide reductase [Gammaproteobacteria bacterium]
MTKSFLLHILLLLSLSPFSSANEISVQVSAADEITAEHYPGSGNNLIVWIAPEYGFRTGHRVLAEMLSKQGIEIWMVDMLDALFLPHNSTSIKNLRGKYVANIVEQAHNKTGKKIIVMGDSYASLSVLYGIHEWQEKEIKKNYLIGAILFSPYTYQSIPPLGQLPVYMPIISATNIPIMIYQAENNGNIGQFNTLVKKLQQHGNPVYTRITPKVMSIFYREEVSAEMREQLQPLPLNIKKMISILKSHPFPQKVIPLKHIGENKTGIDTSIKNYTGAFSPHAIHLFDAHGNKVNVASYKGKVTIVNFWATWCPPCVEEIPSLNRLKEKMKGHNFELISINYAEDKQTIIDFMKKVNVEFPVLLDPNGEFAKKWNVLAYPSTFIIDKNGKIKYGVNAAIIWDSPEVIIKIKSLL